MTPTQQKVLDRLKCAPADRPTFDAGLADDLRAELEIGLAPFAADEPTRISKHLLSSLHGCEARHLAEQDGEFEWDPAKARGVIAHKAIELSVHWRGEMLPGELTDEAIARLTEKEQSIGEYLQKATEADLAEIAYEANERVAAFLEGFPPLDRKWIPRPESKLWVDLCDDAFVMAGKTDLTLGKPDGTRAGKVILDMKTGGYAVAHRDDLRFYALLETLKNGVPPRLVATFYLDSCRLEAEEVTREGLEVTVLRIIDAVAVLRRLEGGAEPTLRPSRMCRWCPLLDECVAGQSAMVDDAA